MAKQRPLGTVKEIERELDDLEARRDELDRAIARLRRVLTWLRRQQNIADSEPATPQATQSLTHTCRAILRMSPEGLTTVEMKRLLTVNGFKWDGFTNPMSAVHTVLKRLVRQDEATAKVSRDGVRRFAPKRTVAIAMTRSEIDDSALLKKLLAAGSPEAVLAALEQHRAGARG